jgi:hypothetical protein
MAAFAVLVLLGHLLFAQLTFVLAIVFAGVGKASRWRLWWLAVPAAVGLAWTLTGPRAAAAGFVAGPAQILGYFGGHPLDRLLHPHGAFAGSGGWLLRQFPLALIAGAAEAALVGWLDWMHTDEWAVSPRRPGLLAAARRALASRMIRAGAVLTRDGCVLGVASATGAQVVLGWPEVAGGVLITGADARTSAVSSLQVVHAALRRRRPLIAVDLSGANALAEVLGAACLATGTPLHGVDESQAGRWLGDGRNTVALARVVRERSAVLFTLRTPDVAGLLCAAILALGEELRGIRVDGDGLVWLYGYESPSDGSLPGLVAGLVAGGASAGLPVLITATSPRAITDLAGLVSAVLVHRLGDAATADVLAARTGTRLVPASWAAGAQAAALSHAAGAGQTGLMSLSGLTQQPGLTRQPVLTQLAAPAGWQGPPAALAASGLVPRPAVSARTLLSLGPAEFVLAVSSPRYRLVELGQAVAARLPRGAVL